VASAAETDASVVKAITLWQKAGWGYGPSFRDIAAETGLPLGTVHRICRRLREQGQIDFHDQTARSLRPTSSGQRRK
jgi:DNA-binding IclR family transcriptional regulator